MDLKEILKACLDDSYLTPSQEIESKKRKAFFDKFKEGKN